MMVNMNQIRNNLNTVFLKILNLKQVYGKSKISFFIFTRSLKLLFNF